MLITPVVKQKFPPRCSLILLTFAHNYFFTVFLTFWGRFLTRLLAHVWEVWGRFLAGLGEVFRGKTRLKTKARKMLENAIFLLCSLFSYVLLKSIYFIRIQRLITGHFSKDFWHCLENFRDFFGTFLALFWHFFDNFWYFFGKFWEIFGK